MQFGTEAGEARLDEQLEFYLWQGMWVLIALGTFVRDHHFHYYREYFDGDQGTALEIFINHEGTRKLRDEWPGIWRDFEFEFYVA